MNDEPEASSAPAPQRRSLLRFFRFRLRTLLILVPLLTFFAAYGVRAWYAERVHAWAISQIEAAGGVPILNERRDVINVQMQQLTLNDEKLRALLPAFQALPRLQTIVLAGNEISDYGVEPLAELPALQQLYLADTLVTPEGIARMKQRNPALQVDVSKRSPKASKMAARAIYNHAILSLATTLDGRLLSGSADGTLRFWDLRRPEAESVVQAHTNWAFAVAQHPRQFIAATGGGDGLIKLWDVQTGDETGQFVGHDDDVHAIAFTPDGKTLVSSADDRTVRIWNFHGRSEQFVLTGHEGTIPTVAVSPDGALAASGSRDHTIRLWNIKTGEPAGTLLGHQNDVMFVDFAPSGRELASVGYDGTLKLWNLAEQREIESSLKHGDQVFAVRWSPDGSRLLTGAGDGVRCFRRDTLRMEWHEDQRSATSAVVWLNDQRLATASVDGLVTVREASGKLITRITALASH